MVKYDNMAKYDDLPRCCKECGQMHVASVYMNGNGDYYCRKHPMHTVLRLGCCPDHPGTTGKIPEYPCIACRSPSERDACYGCEKESEWIKNYTGEAR